jgi:hypothetical protein
VGVRPSLCVFSHLLPFSRSLTTPRVLLFWLLCTMYCRLTYSASILWRGSSCWNPSLIKTKCILNPVILRASASMRVICQSNVSTGWACILPTPWGRIVLCVSQRPKTLSMAYFYGSRLLLLSPSTNRAAPLVCIFHSIKKTLQYSRTVCSL